MQIRPPSASRSYEPLLSLQQWIGRLSGQPDIPTDVYINLI